MVNEGDGKLIESGGVIDLYVQILKIKHLPGPSAGLIIDLLEKFHFKGILSSHSYLKIFDGLMSRL